MLCLPLAPQHKLLTGLVVNVDPAVGRDFTIEERWYKNGRYQMFVNGELREDNHYLNAQPFVQVEFSRWPWEGM